jgi:hypothetical protein
MSQVIIANRLIDGLVVFFAGAGQWNTAIAQAKVIDEDGEAQQLLEVAKQDQVRCLVIDPILIQVRVENGQVRPVEIREVIRAFGPTIRTDLEDTGPAVVISREADRRADGAGHLRRSTKE